MPGAVSGIVAVLNAVIPEVDPYFRELGLHRFSLAEQLGVHQWLFGVGDGGWVGRRKNRGVTEGDQGIPGRGIQVTGNYSSTDHPIPFVYGELRVGGMDTIPPWSTGDSQRYLHRAITISAGRIDRIGDVYLDADRIPNSTFAVMSLGTEYHPRYLATSHSANSGTNINKNIASFFEISKYLGTSSHGADRRLVSAIGSHMTYFRGNNVAWAGMRYQLNDAHDNFRSIPQTSFVVRGICCYDPRKDSTVSGGSGSHRFADPTTWEFSQCPPLCIAHHLTHRLAGGYDYDEISWQSVMTAADVCDTLVNVPSGTQKRFTCNGMLFAPQTPGDFIENISNLTAACLGRTIYTNGVWEIHAGAWETPTATVSWNDFITPPVTDVERGDQKRFNTLIGIFNSSSRDYQATPVTLSNSAYQVADGGRIAQTVELPMCTDEFEAQRRLHILLRLSRNQIVVRGTLPPRFSDLAMLQTLTVVNTARGWTSKTFKTVENVMNTDGTYRPTFQEEQSTDWTDPSTTDYTTKYSDYQLPPINDPIPTEPINFTVTPQINGTLMFDVAPGAVTPAGTITRIIRSTNSADASVGTVVWEGAARRVALVMPTSPHWYYAQYRVGSYFSAYSPNTYGVQGKTRPEARSPYEMDLVTDPEIIYSSNLGDYWNVDSSQPALHQGVWSLSLFGGTQGGRIISNCNTFVSGSAPAIWSAPVTPYQRAVLGTTYRMQARFRCSNFVVNTAWTNRYVAARVYGWNGIGLPGVSAGNVFNIDGTALIYHVSTTGLGSLVDSVSWTDISTLTTIGDGVGYDTNSYPYLVTLVSAIGYIGDILEFDYVRATIR